MEVINYKIGSNKKVKNCKRLKSEYPDICKFDIFANEIT